jgi:3-oxoacid CoA-transferase subunit A
MNKIIASADEAVRDIPDGATLMSGGFGLCGNPENLIAALHRKGTTGLTIISNNCGTTELGLGILLKANQVKKIVASYVGENKVFEQQMLSGKLEVELNPQGTLAERIRAGGCGIGGFFTPSGAGTELSKGKETRMIDGRLHVLETPLKADFTIVRAWKADTWGNLVFRKTARNFNPMIAACGKVTVAEVEEIVEIGSLDPECIHTPSIYIDRIVQTVSQKRIEQRTVLARERV